MTETSTPPSQTTKLMTARFGEITIDPDKIITMTTPVPGFPESHQFIMRPHDKESPFIWLQSMDDPELAFIMISPTHLIPAYRPELPPAVMEELQIEEPQQVELMVILTIPDGRLEDMTANLLGPVALNPGKRLAKQVVLDPKIYDSRWQVLIEEDE